MSLRLFLLHRFSSKSRIIHEKPCICTAQAQQTASGTLTWHCFALCFPYQNLYCISSSIWTRMFTFVQTVFFSFETFSAPPLSPKAGFLQRLEESKIKDGILVIKAPEFPVDLQKDLNAPCLRSLLGHAGNPKDSPLYLIPCQKQSLWGSGARRASSPEPLCTLPPT